MCGCLFILKDGINGMFGGDIGVFKKWVCFFCLYVLFVDVDIKWSEGIGLDVEGCSFDFLKFSVKVCDEIVLFGVLGELWVDEYGVVGGGIWLIFEELYEFVDVCGDEVVFFDGCNVLEV